jgi:hypothetical protein
MKFDVFQLGQSSIAYIYAIKDEIDMEPSYQRIGDVWNLSKRQLLIDSIINGYDIPKLYFHSLDDGEDSYAVIDGKQRLEAIWGFMTGKYSLSKDFIYLRNPEHDMAGMSYKDLAKVHPRTRAKFDSFSLPIFCIRTNDLEVIEEMFTRLNEGSPLNAAEKRNAYGGEVPEQIRSVAKHEFFQERVSFSDSRYKYYDSACKLLYLEKLKKVADTKKIHLDSYAKSGDGGGVLENVTKVLGWMTSHFTEKDPLLKASGMIPVYYLLFRLGFDIDSCPVRAKILSFEDRRKQNREIAKEADDFENVDLDLLEFDRLSQSPNDSAAIQFRAQILASACGVEGLTFERMKNFPSMI